MDEKELLKLAKGVGNFSEREQYWFEVPEKRQDIEQKRKLARRIVFKIIKYKRFNDDRKPDGEDYEIIRKMIEPQLDNNMGLHWHSFSDRWDLHPLNHTKVVIKEDWFREGGGVDLEFGLHKPTAFTAGLDRGQ